MDPDRWGKVERIFHAALEAEEGRRAAILEESCAGDESLRREVESLLAHHGSGEGFMERPAFATSSASASTKSQRTVAIPDLLGLTIAQYRIVEEIGVGGMGVVYKAEDTKLGREVALKFLPENLATDSVALQRFRREARAASALNHPNICTIYDISEYEGRHFIAMEYVAGETIKDKITGHALSTDGIVRLGTQIAEALSAAHSKGVVHRDIKPGNLMVTGSGLVKVFDFGLAKLLPADGITAPVTNLTDSHSVSGTLPYMSPEQLRNREVDARTDIYALGVVLYEMATGQRPFTAELLPQLIDEILHTPPPLPRDRNPKFSVKLEEIILKCLEKDPEDRYQTAKEIAVDLRRMIAPSAVSTHLVRGKPKRVGRIFAVVAGFVLAAALGAGIFRSLESRFFSPTSSIAVLPFVDESKDASQYLSDGVTEGVINKLSQLPGLRVMSRNAVFRFKGKDADAQVAGRDLHVQAVLAGRIARQDEGYTINAELVNVSDGSQIWGRQFRYSKADLLRAQDDLATAVSDKLHLPVNDAGRARLARRATDSPEAYQLYLQGRYFFNQRSRPGIQKSIDLFQQATEKDPNFALAYAGLAQAYNMSTILGMLSPKESYPAARAAASKALVLDPLLPEAHAALGTVKSHYDFDFPGAQREFLKAIELNPSYADAHLFYAGGYFTPMGRHEDAISEMKKALELDPLSLPLNNYLGETYLLAGYYDRAIQQFQHTMDLDPKFALAHSFIIGPLLEMGKYEQAIKEMRKGELLSGATPEEVAAYTEEFEKAFQMGGPRGYWQKVLEERLKDYKLSGVGALEVAGAYAKVGDKDKAFEWLQKAYEERSANLSLVNYLPEFKSLHGDARFSKLLKDIGLPD